MPHGDPTSASETQGPQEVVLRYHCALWVWVLYGAAGCAFAAAAWDCAAFLLGRGMPAGHACYAHPWRSLCFDAFGALVPWGALAARAALCLRGRVRVGPAGVRVDMLGGDPEIVAWDGLVHIVVPSTGKLRGHLETRSGRTVLLWSGVRPHELIAAIGQWVELGPPQPSRLFPTFHPRREYDVLRLRHRGEAPPMPSPGSTAP